MHGPQTTARLLLTGSLAGLMACAGGQSGEKAEKTPVPPGYGATDIVEMGGDLVAAKVTMQNVTSPGQIDDYTRCTVAGFARSNGAGFVRHIRTNTKEEGGVWHADAVYSVTSALPEGVQTIDAEVTVDDCLSRGIPTGTKGRG